MVVKVAQVVASPEDYAGETADITDPVQRAVDSSLILYAVQRGIYHERKKSRLRLLIPHHLRAVILH